jgi:hypothetical protein
VRRERQRQKSELGTMIWGASGGGSGSGRDPSGAVLVVRHGERVGRRGFPGGWGEANRGGPDAEDQMEKIRSCGSGAQGGSGMK